MTVLDLGCGWGSVALHVADRYPQCKVFALSNSFSQKEFILDRAKERGLANLQVFTGDIALFDEPDFAAKFDRIISIEMFEHMKNYEKLMAKLSNWLAVSGKLFIHIFTHKQFSYHFNKGWMARTFFTGGTMPSADLLLHFQQNLVLEDRWTINGRHYARTLDAWLKRQDDNVRTLMQVLEKTYGDSQLASRWFANWRMFFIVCSETFAYNNGNDWFVSLYLFAKR